MSTPELHGYAYRRAPVDASTIVKLAAELLPGPVWSFGGSAQWDFSAQNGRGNLRAVRLIEVLDADELRGDSGHCFSEAGEVRWRRLDDNSYDLLLLREAPLADEALSRLKLRLIGVFAATVVPAASGALIEEGYTRLGLVEYRDPASLAVRLVRYSERQPASSGSPSVVAQGAEA